MQQMIEVRDLVKNYGDFCAVNHISFSVETGKIFGFLGPNGAGKTTTIKMLTTVLVPSSGTVRVNGHDPTHDQKEVRRSFGIVFQDPSLDDELTAQENLRYFASLYPGQKCLSPAEALRQVGLDPALQRPFGQYSQGMRQRTSLARVLLPIPELLLLDEPFSNMDVESVQQMVELLSGFRQGNRTIVITTHQRDAAAPIADWVLALKAGRVASFEPGSPTK